MQQAKHNIAFIINSLEGGGAERVMCKLLTIMEADFQSAGYNVHLILLDDLPQEQQCPEYVNQVVLDTKGSLHSGYSALKKALEKIAPHTCVSFLTRANMLNVSLAKRLGYRAVISERVNTSSHLSGGLKDFISRCLVKATYPSADCVIAVSEGVKADLIENFSVKRERIKTIYNPYNMANISAMAQQPVDDLPSKPYIIGTGRLVRNKNFDLLLQAVAASSVGHDIVILGQGEEKQALLQRAESLGLSGRLHLLGFKSNPYPYIKGADFFVSTSNAEGFPNAIAEAMCLGKAVVATNCESGPAEILTGEYPYNVSGFEAQSYGCICEVNSVSGVAGALDYMSRDENKQRYEQRSAERAATFSNAVFREKLLKALKLQQSQPETGHVSGR